MLQKIRKQHGYTQYDLAEKLGIPVSTYNQYEKGRRTIPLKVVTDICKILGVDKSIFLATGFTICEESEGKE